MEIVNLIAAYGAWSWFVAGLVLLALELVVPGGIFLWLGVAGIITGLAAFLPAVSWPWQFLIFGVLGLVTIGIWMRLHKGRILPSDRPFLNQRAARFVGHEAVIDEPVTDGFGRLVLGDSVWRIAGPDLAAGSRVRIVGHDGAVLKVEAA